MSRLTQRNLHGRSKAVLRFLPLSLILVAQAFLAQSLVFGQSGSEKWISTWVASPQAPLTLGPARAGTFSGKFNNQTVRMVVRTSIGGRRARVQLSNAYGATPLAIGGAHIALRAKDSAIAPGSDHALLFNGKPTCSIPPGAFILSDPVNIEVPKLGDLVVSVYVPGDTGIATTHSVGLHTTYISKQGDTTAAPEMADSITTQSWYWLSGVEVSAPAATASVVTFGDSITDGTRSTPNTDSSWPSFLAKRLPNIAVLNQGISANRVLRDGFGASALGRFDRDVISQPGVKWVTLLEGINDIGAGIGAEFVFGPKTNMPASDIVTADALILGYKQLIERAHEHHIKIMGSPLMPFEGAAYYSADGNGTRAAVNNWIRTSGAFDSLIDFDALMRSPDNPNRMRAEYDSGDHLHPNDEGYKAMAATINLALFD
jgi:lysophospholipase L1-like esterase